MKEIVAKTARLLGWACCALFVAGLAFSVEGGGESLTLPDLVVKGIDSSRLEARRRGAIPIDSALPAPELAQVELPVEEAAEVEQREAPKAQAPGCAYSNPMTSALARLGNSPEAYYKSGLAALGEERLDEAAYYFDQVTVRNPGHPLAGSSYYWLAEVKRRQGKAPEALVAYRKVQGDYARDALYRYSWLAGSQGRDEEALEAWGTIAADLDSPHRAEALFRLGSHSLEKEDYLAALDKLTLSREVAEAGSDLRAAATYLLAVAQRSLGMLKEAEGSITRLLLERPDHPSAEPARLLLAWVLLERGEGARAQSRFEAFISSSPPPGLAVRAHYGLARLALERGDATEALIAIENIDLTGEPGPWHGWAWSELATMYFDRAELKKALGAYRTSLSVWQGGDTGAVRYMEGECLHRLGDYEGAAKALALVERESPVAPAAWTRSGVSLIISGDTAGALKRFEKVIATFPAYGELDTVWAWIGEARLRLSKEQEALEAFEAVSPESPAYAQALYSMAWIAFGREHWDEAAKLFSRHLNNYPRDPNRDEAALALARSHYNRRSITAAIAVLDDLEETAKLPKMADAARYHRGWMQVRVGHHEKGWQTLSELVERSPDGDYAHKAHFALGWSYFGEERYEKAAHHFGEVGKLGRGGEEALEAARKQADSLFNLGRYQEALDAYRALGETPEGRWGAALSLARLGRTDQLVEEVESFVRDYPDDRRGSDLLLTAARALEEEGDHAAAATLFERAALKMEASAALQAQLMMAVNLSRSGQEEQAANLMAKLAEGEGVTALSALSELAALNARRGEDTEAMRRYGELGDREEKAPRRIAAYRRGAELGDRAGSWDEALKLVEKGLALTAQPDPAASELTLQKGELLLGAERAGAAIELVAPLIEGGEGLYAPVGVNLRARELTGRALEASGRGEEALEVYMRIGYLYSLEESEAAAATLRAADLMREADNLEAARALYEKLVRKAGPPWSGEAGLRLKGLPSAPAGDEAQE